MRGIWMFAVLAIGGACGGPTKGGTTTTTTTVTEKQAPKAADGPACADMATKVVAMIAAGRGDRFQGEAPRMTEIVRERCEKDAWSAEIRRCMITAEERAAAIQCFKQLTPEQQQAMEDAERQMRKTDEAADGDGATPAATGAAPPPPPAAAPPPAPGAPSKASAPEKDTKKRKAMPKGGKVNSDPCMGGE